jgi:60 kDa SS-A/Ro ribonucleoprotein
MYLSKFLNNVNNINNNTNATILTIPTRAQHATSVINLATPLPTPQFQPLHQEQVRNNAGGYVFQIDDMIFFQRFLFLGTEKGTYYTSETIHTYLNIECIDRLLNANRGEEMLDMMIKINEDNRVAKTAPINFALAYLAKLGNVELRRKVYQNLTKFLRIPTHLFEFLEFSKSISKNKNNSNGWGRLQRQFIQQWYGTKNVEQLMYQVTKYQQRNGWNHRDVFRLAHVTPNTTEDAEQRKLLYSWIVKKELSNELLNKEQRKVHSFLTAFEKLQKLGETINNCKKNVVNDDNDDNNEQMNEIVRLIHEYGFVREHLPTTVLNSKSVWEALLTDMPLGALIRNLNKLTKLGIFDGYQNEHLDNVISKITNETILSKARIHPLKLIVAMMTYSKGKGDKGSMVWIPNQQICNALNDAYYKSFKYVKPTGKRFFIGLDVSGSMGSSQCIGTNLTPREGSACLALTIMNLEKQCIIKGFTGSLVDLPLSPLRRLEDNIRDISNLPFGATNLSLPIEYATTNNIPVDCFIILSDNETWVGKTHPSEVLRAYRKKMNLDTRYINIQLTATKFSVADPEDVHSLEIAGFDSGMLETISEFLNWELV